MHWRIMLVKSGYSIPSKTKTRKMGSRRVSGPIKGPREWSGPDVDLTVAYQFPSRFLRSSRFGDWIVGPVGCRVHESVVVTSQGCFSLGLDHAAVHGIDPPHRFFCLPRLLPTAAPSLERFEIFISADSLGPSPSLKPSCAGLVGWQRHYETLDGKYIDAATDSTAKKHVRVIVHLRVRVERQDVKVTYADERQAKHPVEVAVKHRLDVDLIERERLSTASTQYHVSAIQIAVESSAPCAKHPPYRRFRSAEKGWRVDENPTSESERAPQPRHDSVRSGLAQVPKARFCRGLEDGQCLGNGRLDRNAPLPPYRSIRLDADCSIPLTAVRCMYAICLLSWFPEVPSKEKEDLSEESWKEAAWSAFLGRVFRYLAKTLDDGCYPA
ncbi:hypothetical protein L210DRAFT_3674563 [Boletus edulis BED1]|uniref:Uncharacterized protein n=1 Tax=Boletus edulis BED1 TaxID=1328754 RepID=A0AAD4BTA0_BOLED|nr:hypothetical protein L210DRAFT_3674563 [Boletus edulis BED1]